MTTRRNNTKTTNINKNSNYKKNSSSNGADDIYLDPEEELKKMGVYYITGEIESDSLLEIHQDILLKHLNPEWTQDISLIINSVGGCVSEGYALIDLLDSIDLDVRTTGMGECCSMGAMLLAAGTKGKRQATRNCCIMVHGTRWGHISGNEQQLVHAQKDIEQEADRLMRFWIRNSKYTTKSQIKKHFLNGFDKYMTPQIALQHGIIDIIQKEKGKDD